MYGSITYMNKNTICIVCGGKPEQGTSSIIINGHYQATKIPLIRHHVTYNPELIAHVHFNCHMDIHKGLHPHLIQFQDGESKEHYNKKKPS